MEVGLGRKVVIVKPVLIVAVAPSLFSHWLESRKCYSGHIVIYSMVLYSDFRPRKGTVIPVIVIILLIAVPVLNSQIANAKAAVAAVVSLAVVTAGRALAAVFASATARAFSPPAPHPFPTLEPLLPCRCFSRVLRTAIVLRATTAVLAPVLEGSTAPHLPPRRACVRTLLQHAFCEAYPPQCSTHCAASPPSPPPTTPPLPPLPLRLGEWGQCAISVRRAVI